MNTKNTKENNNATPAQDMVLAGVRKIAKCSQWEGFSPRDGKIIMDAAVIYANGFSQGYAMGKDRNIAE